MDKLSFPPEQQRQEPWRLDLSRYDRQVALAPVEQQTIKHIVEKHSTGKHRPFASYEGFQRLLHPLHDICSLTHASKIAYAGVVRVLVTEMHQRQITYWGWSPSDWQQVLGSDPQTFKMRHQIQGNNCRPFLMIMSYLVGNISNLHIFGRFYQTTLAYKLFGQELVDEATQRVVESARTLGFCIDHPLRLVTIETLLFNRSPFLEDITLECLETVRQSDLQTRAKSPLFTLSYALTHLGIVRNPLDFIGNNARNQQWQDEARKDIDPTWLAWCDRWFNTSTLTLHSRKGIFIRLLKAGRWLRETHSEIVSPDQWNRELAAEYVAIVDRMVIGQWISVVHKLRGKVGKPLTPRAKAHEIMSMRCFIRDCQTWEWMPIRFDPVRYLHIPRSISSLIGPSPRVIADDIWAKLLWAGLNLIEEDLPQGGLSPQTDTNRTSRWTWYPLEMVVAIAVVWLFAGLRSDEIRRLRVGCIRWQRNEVNPGEGPSSFSGICMLDVPTNKTGTAFTKPVDRIVGEAILKWEKHRLRQPQRLDLKTGELVHYLFSHRGIHIGIEYLNLSLIPLLCRKAGVPEQDARGNITSHRARSTIATQLFNAKDPMSLFELQEWLGHKDPKSTQYYAKITPTKLMKAFTDAGYFERNLRAVNVLIDQDAVKNGAAATGETWRYYDLGHGYCAYDFFDQCPHRMACAKCAFYSPKNSSRMQLLEGKANLLHMMQMIPLSEEERAAVEDGIQAMETLCSKLVDVSTPAGPTPRQLEGNNHPSLITDIPRRKTKQ